MQDDVEAIRDAMLSTLLLVGKDMTDEQVEALAQAALAAMQPTLDAYLELEEKARDRRYSDEFIGNCFRAVLEAHTKERG